jgi:hypothetical protein
MGPPYSQYVPVIVAVGAEWEIRPASCRGVSAAAFVIAKARVIAMPAAATQTISLPGCLGLTSGIKSSACLPYVKGRLFDPRTIYRYGRLPCPGSFSAAERSVLLSTEAERVTGWVEKHPDILLRLVCGDSGPERYCLGDG